VPILIHGVSGILMFAGWAFGGGAVFGTAMGETLRMLAVLVVHTMMVEGARLV
jgi:hypothetical protein